MRLPSSRMKLGGDNKNSVKNWEGYHSRCEEGHLNQTNRQLMCSNEYIRWHSNIHQEFMTQRKAVE